MFFFLELSVKTSKILPQGVFQVFLSHHTSTLSRLPFLWSTNHFATAFACAVVARSSSDPTSGVNSLI